MFETEIESVFDSATASEFGWVTGIGSGWAIEFATDSQSVTDSESASELGLANAFAFGMHSEFG